MSYSVYIYTKYNNYNLLYKYTFAPISASSFDTN